MGIAGGRWPAAAALVLALAACSAGQEGGAGANGAEASARAAADAEFVAGHEAWRVERHARLLAPDGWTGLIGLHWIELDAHYLGSRSGMRLAMGPPRLGLLQRREGRLYFVPERGVDVSVGGEPVTGRIELHDDRSQAPTLVDFDGGLGQFGIIRRGGRQAVRVRHMEAPSRASFSGVDYWPVDRGWSVQAHFRPHPPGRSLEVPLIVGGVETVANPGLVEFERDGQLFALEAMDDGDGGLLVIFADRTSGHGSYGGGRYLDVAMPGADGRVVLDFNRAYNPPCAFTNHATCPLPPPGNRLDLAIPAGEKAHAPAG